MIDSDDALAETNIKGRVLRKIPTASKFRSHLLSISYH
jgi:hypothetical protein